MTDNTRNALEQLKDAINPEKYKDCQIGLVFDVQIYLEALKLYDENFRTFETRHRLLFWCVRVEELIVSALPTVYLRAHCQGIGNVVFGDIVNWDKLGKGCVLADGSSYFNRDPNDLPGRHFFVGEYGARGGSDVVRPWGRGGWSRSIKFETYVKHNNEIRDRLYATIFPRQQACLSNTIK